MKNNWSRYVVLYFASFCHMASASVTHCEDKNQIIFNCRVENSKKVISVCILKPGQKGQYLQYVFGEVGKAELVFPKQGHIKNGQFLFEGGYSDNSGWRQYDLIFNIGEKKYDVYWEELSKTDGIPKEKTEISSGVMVSTGSGKSVNISCDAGVVHNFNSAYGYNVKEIGSQ